MCVQADTQTNECEDIFFSLKKRDGDAGSAVGNVSVVLPEDWLAQILELTMGGGGGSQWAVTVAPGSHASDFCRHMHILPCLPIYDQNK